MALFNQGDDFNAERIISDFKSIEGIEEQLKFVLLHLYALDKDNQEKFRPQIIQYEKLVGNVKFMRKIRYRDSILKEFSSEYYGNDYGDDDPFMYNEELEVQINKIGMRLLATVGLVAKSMKEKNIVIGEDT